MSVPIAIAVVTATLATGGTALHLAAQVEVRHRAAATAEVAALAAADAHFGLIDAAPCALAGQVATQARLQLMSCAVGQMSVTVEVGKDTIIGGAFGSARAGVDHTN